MNRNESAALAAKIVAGIFCAVHCQVTSANSLPEGKPNILLILSDDHSAPFLGCYGNQDIKTPNMDRLAREGIMFKRAYTAAPQSVPSRACILTGRNVLDVQMLRFSAPLDKNIITFPELLGKAGYYTGICGRSYHLDGSGSMPPETAETFKEFGMRTFAGRVDYLKTGNDNAVLSQVTEFLNRNNGNKPFFLWANYSDPHRIYNAKDYEPDPQSIHIPDLMPDTKLLREDLAGYLGEIQRLDHNIGLLLNELEKRNILDNTLILLMGDNGGGIAQR